MIYYQFSWSLFTINQSSRRAWRIGQTQECRLYYLAYENSFQEKMAQLIAMKNRATAAINGEVSSDGLSAMLGDEGDLQSLLIQSVKRGGDILKGSAEEWINQSSDRAREILANIGKKKTPATLQEQFEKWMELEIKGPTTLQAMKAKVERICQNIKDGDVAGFVWHNGVLEIDYTEAFGFSRDFVSDGAILYHLTHKETAIESESRPASVTSGTNDQNVVIKLVNAADKKSKRQKQHTSDNQLVFDLFG